MSSNRPDAVTAIAVLNIIGGVIMLFVGLAIVVPDITILILQSILQVLLKISGGTFEQQQQSTIFADNINPFWMSSALSSSTIIIGVILIAMGFSLLHNFVKEKRQVWTIITILSIISIIVNATLIATGILSEIPIIIIAGIVSMSISGIVPMFCFYRRDVKRYFGMYVKPLPEIERLPKWIGTTGKIGRWLAAATGGSTIIVVVLDYYINPQPSPRPIYPIWQLTLGITVVGLVLLGVAYLGKKRWEKT